MKLLIHSKNKEYEVEDTQRLKEHLKALIELIDIYENTNDVVVFQIPSVLIKKI